MLLLDHWNKENKQIDLWQKDQYTFHIVNFFSVLLLEFFYDNSMSSNKSIIIVNKSNK